jgi:hypothetical protein
LAGVASASADRWPANEAQKQAKNPPDETISRNPRNHPETDEA